MGRLDVMIKEMIKEVDGRAEKVGVLEFSTMWEGIHRPSKVKCYQREVEERIVLMRTKESIHGIDTSYWSNAKLYAQNMVPTQQGEIDESSLERFGLADPSKTIIKIYPDGIYIPNFAQYWVGD